MPCLLAICVHLSVAFALTDFEAIMVYAHGDYLSPIIQNRMLFLPFGNGQAVGQAAQLFAVSVVNDSILAYHAQPLLLLPLPPYLIDVDMLQVRAIIALPLSLHVCLLCPMQRPYSNT